MFLTANVLRFSYDSVRSDLMSRRSSSVLLTTTFAGPPLESCISVCEANFERKVNKMARDLLGLIYLIRLSGSDYSYDETSKSLATHGDRNIAVKNINKK